MTKSKAQAYYSSRAYSPEKTPKQASLQKQTHYSSRRLPWGSTQQATSIELMQDTTPKGMRFWESCANKKEQNIKMGTYTPAIFEGVELHNKCDQERFRFAPLPFRSQFWIIMLQFGRGSFFVFLAAILLTHPLIISASRESWQATTIKLLIEVYPVILGIPLVLWSISHIVVNHFPRLWFRPPKGPDWELNRRTGLVTIFDYKRHRKEGVIDEFVAPFYEFDAYMTTTNNRHGPTYGLLLQHRYEDRKINFHMLMNADDFQQRPCALWDFLQNYMDTSGPIPDIPLFEPYRHLDPVTASYDQKRGRDPRYWIDMDDATFKAEVDAMWQRVYAIDTFSRPNLMARYVDYGS